MAGQRPVSADASRSRCVVYELQHRMSLRRGLHRGLRRPGRQLAHPRMPRCWRVTAEECDESSIRPLHLVPQVGERQLCLDELVLRGAEFLAQPINVAPSRGNVVARRTDSRFEAFALRALSGSFFFEPLTFLRGTLSLLFRRARRADGRSLEPVADRLESTTLSITG